MNRRKRSARSGQALVEFALSATILFLVLLGSTDLARAFYFNVEVSGASREGTRLAIESEVNDVGDAVRSEPNTAIPNNPATWGDTAAGGVNGDCIGSGGGTCGDPNGCPPSVFVGSRLACFAIRYCLDTGHPPSPSTSGGDVCLSGSWSAWGQRAPSASGHGIQVLVVYKFVPSTPVMTAFTGNAGAFYLRVSTTAAELY